MDMEKLFESASLDGIADNVFGVVNNSVSEVKEMQRKKVAENVQLVVDALKKIESNISSRYDLIGNTLEKRILTIKDGRDGIHGRDGRNGKDGKNGRDGLPGPRGADGKPGRDGADGSDGVSVTDAKIDFDGSLIISLSSGREINVGEVVAPALAEQIKVITNGGGTSQSVIDTLASLQAQITALSGAVIYKGLWNALTNTPTLTSSVGTSGNFYIVSVAGSTSLDGITNWGVGDWAIFNGTAWQRVEGGAAGNFTTVTASGTISAGDTLSMSKASVGAQGGQVANTSTATNAWASWRVSNGTRNLHLTTTSTGWSGTHLTGGPTSEQSAIYTDGAIPLVFGVSNTMVGQFTSTGLNSTAIGATTPSTGAFTTLSATGLLTGANFTIGDASGGYWGVTNSALARTDANYAIQQSSTGTTTIGAPTGQLVNLSIAGTVKAQVSSTGLAVTGTLTSTLDATHYGVTVGRGGGAVASNTVAGASALASGSNTGGGTVAVGYYALNAHTSGNFNTAVGYSALETDTSGVGNSAFGAVALDKNNGGAYNTGIGNGALFSNTTASNNTAVGYQAGYSSNPTTGVNTYIGSSAGYSQSTGDHNTFVGGGTGYNATSGSGNTFIGRSAGGVGAGRDVTTGGKNIIIGGYSGSAAPISATGSNFVVLSDGDGNIVASTKTAQTFALQGGTLSSGTGIAFPATQSASSDANTLDDYEEGTWTPTQGAGLTVVGAFSSSGTYTKIGRQVTVTGQLSGATSVSTAAGNAVACGNLPFTPAGSTTYHSGAGTNNGLSISTTFMAFNNNNVYCTQTIAATPSLFFTITYYV